MTPSARNWIEVVLTGGPGAGKTTSLARMSATLSERGARALVVPEVATQIVLGGVSDLERLAEQEPATYLKVEAMILDLQRDMRIRYRQLAEALAPQKVAIIYDRAEMDVSVYLESEQFEKLLEERELTRFDVRDSYDLVIHMRTAALGAEEYYTKENNPARREDAAAARLADQKTLSAWIGHRHLKIASNNADFEKKLERVTACVLDALGLPHPVERERKFLLEDPDKEAIEGASSRIFDIEQTYLLSENSAEEIRVRRSLERLGGTETFTWTKKQDLDDGSRAEYEALISRREWERHLEDQDPSRQPLMKTRYMLISGEQIWEVDRIERPGGQVIWAAEVELVSWEEALDVPECLDLGREVTHEKDFRSAALAQAA